MDPNPLVCAMCGAEIPAGGEAPDDVRSLACPRCADLTASHPRRGGLNRSAIFFATGLMVLVISLLADTLGFGRAAGFGWRQLVATGIAGVCFLCGGIMHIPTLAVVGLLWGGLGLLADWLKFGDSPGFGAHQMVGCALGFVLVALGWFLARGNRNPGA